MEPTIVALEPSILVGIRIQTTLSADPRLLWQRFKPRVKTIENRLGTDFYSVHVYAAGTTFEKFTPNTLFEKWAAVEVSNSDNIPDEMEVLSLPSGLYAVFVHHGLSSGYAQTSQYIFEQWLPNAGYRVDGRPHFDLFGADYRLDDADAREEIWVPIV
jgi:AraC family transcriptional regulator